MLDMSKLTLKEMEKLQDELPSVIAQKRTDNIDMEDLLHYFFCKQKELLENLDLSELIGIAEEEELKEEEYLKLLKSLTNK